MNALFWKDFYMCKVKAFFSRARVHSRKSNWYGILSKTILRKMPSPLSPLAKIRLVPPYSERLVTLSKRGFRARRLKKARCLKYPPLFGSDQDPVEDPDAEAPVDDEWTVVELSGDVLGLFTARVVGDGELLEEG